METPKLDGFGGLFMVSSGWVDALADAYGAVPDDVERDYTPSCPDEYGEIMAEMVAGEMAEMAELEALPLPPAGGVLDDDELRARGLATAEDMPKDDRLRWWEVVAWFDSIAPDWVERWQKRPDIRGLAIWHDLDIKNKETGELKKKHLHVMAGDSHGRKWSQRQALAFARDVFGLRPTKDDRLVRPVKSPSGCALYLTHANAPNKHQYARDAVMSFGGADLDLVVGVVDNEKSILSDIYAWVDDFYESYDVLPAFAAIVRYANALKPAWARLLASSRGRVVRSYLQSYEYDEGLDGRGVGSLRIVRAMISAEKQSKL